VVPTGDRLPGVSTVSLDPAKTAAAAYLKGAVNWHMDGATQPKPPNKATILSAHVITDDGDGTDFASTYLAYEELPAADRARYEKLRVTHSVEATQRRLYPNPTPEMLAEWAKMPRHEHPLVWKHRSGRKSLVLGATALDVVGMDEEEGRQLLLELEEWTARPGRVYRHLWSEGDVVIWDNLGMIHKALPYDETSPRELHRSVLEGDEMIA
jgi:alpha-ketoglutarate-dependent taurine dioxygenase